MRRKALRVLLSLLSLTSLAAISCASPEKEKPALTQDSPPVGVKIGNLAPEFSAVDLNGKTVHLADYHGKPILLNFWATWCGPCLREMPFLQKIYEDYSNAGLVIMAINIQENSAKIKEFLLTNHLTIPAFLDKSGIISDEYGIASIPTTFFLDKDGIIRQKIIGSFPDKETLIRELSRIMPEITKE
jgi:thiol-disulfide isomerase/thioredoxin